MSGTDGTGTPGWDQPVPSLEPLDPAAPAADAPTPEAPAAEAPAPDAPASADAPGWLPAPPLPSPTGPASFPPPTPDQEVPGLPPLTPVAAAAAAAAVTAAAAAAAQGDPAGDTVDPTLPPEPAAPAAPPEAEPVAPVAEAPADVPPPAAADPAPVEPAAPLEAAAPAVPVPVEPGPAAEQAAAAGDATQTAEAAHTEPSHPLQPAALDDPGAAITGGAAAAAAVAAASTTAPGEPVDAEVRPIDVPAVPPPVTGPAPELPPGFAQPVPESRAARRRAAEASRAQSHRTHIRLAVLGVGAVVVIALLALLWTWWSGRPGDPAPAPTTTATGTAVTQPTLLLQVTAAEDVAVSNSLLSVGGPLGRANMIGIPQNTLMDVATGGTLPFGQIARLPDPDGSADALSDSIGVNVDGTFKLDTAALSGLVDAVGGITADVDVDVVETASDGTQTILVPAGPGQVLQGPAAAAFATYLAEGETEEARIARFTQVVRLAVGKLPADVTQVETILTQLGASAESTVPFDQLAAFFVRMQADIAADDVVYRNLPVKPIDAGGPAAYRVDNDAAAVMVQELLPEAVRTPGPNSKVRVLVQNGVGSPGLNAAARQLLVDAGFTYVNGGNAPQFGQAATVIIVPDTTSESIAWGQQIAAALTVPESAVQVAIDGQSVADVIVVLGGDFVPEAT